MERVKNIADELKEKLPTMLNSKQGLYVACSVFTVLDAKDRKVVVKSLKEILKETFTNRIAHLFIIHVVNTLDDTMLSKKKILQELLKNLDEMISDKCY
jgi:pumilio family protein 6